MATNRFCVGTTDLQLDDAAAVALSDSSLLVVSDVSSPSRQMGTFHFCEFLLPLLLETDSDKSSCEEQLPMRASS